MADLSTEIHGNNTPTKRGQVDPDRKKAQYEVEPPLLEREKQTSTTKDDPLGEIASLKQQMDVAKEFHTTGPKGNPPVKLAEQAEAQNTHDKYTTSD